MPFPGEIKKLMQLESYSSTTILHWFCKQFCFWNFVILFVPLRKCESSSFAKRARSLQSKVYLSPIHKISPILQALCHMWPAVHLRNFSCQNSIHVVQCWLFIYLSRSPSRSQISQNGHCGTKLLAGISSLLG